MKTARTRRWSLANGEPDPVPTVDENIGTISSGATDTPDGPDFPITLEIACITPTTPSAKHTGSINLAPVFDTAVGM